MGYLADFQWEMGNATPLQKPVVGIILYLLRVLVNCPSVSCPFT